MDMVTQVVLDVLGNVIAGRIEDIIHHFGNGDSALSWIAGEDELASRMADAFIAHGVDASLIEDVDWDAIGNALRAPVS